MFSKKLSRSTTNKMLTGVCGGIAEYFEIDATVVRIAWAIVSAFAGAGVIAYIAASVIMPKDIDIDDEPVDTSYRDNE